MAALPRTAAIAARLVYVQACLECRVVANEFAIGCIGDEAVTSLTLCASKTQHCHEEERPQKRLEPKAETDQRTMAELQAWLTEPVSDTNGTLGPHDLPNGFDVES